MGEKLTQNRHDIEVINLGGCWGKGQISIIMGIDY